MNLLVDVGNTRIKWAFQYDDALSPGTGVEYDKSDFAVLAHNNWGKMEIPRRVLVANVAGGGLGEQLSAWVTRRWRITPEFLLPERQAHGVTNAYANPQQLGADRWACLLAARHQISGPACIIDCGTATTVDVLSGTGEHMGGLILPGIEMMRQSLAGNTAQIPNGNTQSRTGTLDLAQSTEQAVLNGCFYSTVAAIERVIAEITNSLDKAVTTVITGGYADRVASLLAIPVEHKPDFVLQGLSLVARANS